MVELRGKGFRVLGFFVWMLGAGIVLDGGVQVAGGVLLVGGALLFGIGAWQSARPAPAERGMP